jgi:hypothetical protein
MDVGSSQSVSLVAKLSDPVAAGMLFGAVGAWAVLHLLSGRVRRASAHAWAARAGMFAARVAAAGAAMLLAAQLTGRGVLLATDWPVWPLAAAGAVALETVLSLYRLERQTAGRAAGAALATMRGVAVLLVVAMLAQPVVRRQETEGLPRYVAVLVDESASMRVADSQRTPAERLRLAGALGVAGAERRHRLDQVEARLVALREQLAAMGEELVLLGGQGAEARGRLLAARRAAMERSFAGGAKLAEQQGEAIGKVLVDEPDLPGELGSALREAKGELAAGVRDRLMELAEMTGAGAEAALGERQERLAQGVRKVGASLADVGPRLAALGEKLDAAAYAALNDATRKAVDEVAERTRLELAREILMGGGGATTSKDPEGLWSPGLGVKGGGSVSRDSRGLLARLSKGYEVKVYTFAGRCQEADAASWPAPKVDGNQQEKPAIAPCDDLQGTDVAGALNKVIADMAGKQLSGVVMLGDGRHNAAERVEPPAGQLGLRKSPVCSIVMAPRRAPRDAAVIGVEAPESVAEGDQVQVEAELKLDGLAGAAVCVALYDGPSRVDPNAAPRVVVVPVGADSYRTSVQFRHTPKGGGMHAYSVRIDPVDGEAVAANNAFAFAVGSTGQRTRLLLIDSRPRWEFRYIKNLFADRDRGVQLQYVLLHPDRIADANARPPVHASASRAVGEVEATALPASRDEWNKFDVILLGDVERADLTGEQIDTLARFVTEGGRTLIVIAGSDAMPHAYGGTPLADVLPFTFQATTQPAGGGGPTDGFRVALTAAGRRSVLMAQDNDPRKSEEVWASFPEMTWRHPTCRARPGATVLAYALGAGAPGFLLAKGSDANGGAAEPRRASADASDEDAAARDEQIRRYQQDNALIALQQTGAGRVLALAFDHTWRLRYRVGDTHHHRFWGQVLRWAASEKLQAGTEFVKLGTDRTRYSPAQSVRVRARIVRRDLSPLASERVFAAVTRDGAAAARRQLLYVPGSHGMYEGELPALPSGAYRVTLESPEIGAILEPDGVKSVSTEFSVDPAGGPEQTELSADMALLRRLAEATGGVVVGPEEASAVMAALGPVSSSRTEVHETRLWDSWLLLAAIIVLATGEWLLRKKRGLT